MNNQEIMDAIANAFSNLADLNQQLYDFWISALYDEQDEMIMERWNERNLKLMEEDVMMQQLVAND